MKKKLNLIQINDTHSYLQPHPEFFYSPEGIIFSEAGGYSRIKTFIEQQKEKGPTLVLDNGDTIHGTYEVVQEKGRNMVPLLNQMDISAMTFHWDIAYGPQHLKEIEQELDYPILAINVFEEETNDLFFEPYRVFDVEGISVGVIGIACNIIDKTMPPSFSEGIYFTNGEKELAPYVKELQEKGVDLIVVLSHLGFPQDCRLISEVDGVDICLSAHTHNRMEKSVEINGTTIIQSGSQGSFIGMLELEMDGNVQVKEHKLIKIDDSIPENPQIKLLAEEAVAPYEEYLNQKVGETKVDLFRGLNTESTMDNFLLEAVFHAAGADAAFSNGWRYGAPVPKGPVYLRDLYQMVPMDPPVSVAELTGKEIVKMLEENLENTYSANPFHQMGGYVKRAYNLHAYFKVENPKGTRILRLFIGDEEVQEEKTYKIAYVTNQGVPSKYGQNHHSLSKTAIQAMQDYLQKTGPYEGKIKGHFTLA